MPEPLFENRRGEFVVTLRHSMEPAEPSCDGAQTDLLSYCTVPRTRQEIAAFLGIKTQLLQVCKVSSVVLVKK